MNSTLSITLINDKKHALRVVNTLYNQAIDPPVFYSAGMLNSFAEVSSQPFYLLLGQVNTQPVIALPMVKSKTWQNVTYAGWDNLDVLKSAACTNQDEHNFWREAVTRFKQLKLVEWSQHSAGYRRVKGVKPYAFDNRKCPYIVLMPTWEELNTQLGKKLVRNIRQYGNKAAEHGIQFSVFKAADKDEKTRLSLLEEAIGFHNKRMHDKNQDSKFSTDLHYHQTVMQNPENLFFITATHNNKLIACYYGLMNKTRMAWFNGGYSPDYYKFSMGTLLVAELIAFALKNGIKIFDFLRGNEAYKQKWTALYNRNQDVFLAPADARYTIKTKLWVFNALRHRMGGKQALKLALKT